MRYEVEELVRFWERHDGELSPAPASKVLALGHDLYRRIPPGFNAFFDFAQRLAVEPLLAAGQPRPGEVLLDIGCGTGRWARLGRRYGLRTVGVDLGMRALRVARQLTGGGEWARNLLPQLSFRSCSFDWTVSVTVLQHLAYQEQVICLHEVYRILKPGGRFVILELSCEDDNAPHVFPRTRPGWEGLFKETGFTVAARRACERIPWVRAGQRLSRLFGRGSVGNLGPAGLVRLAAVPFVPVAAALELAATGLNLDRWARYTCWLLVKK